MEVALDQQVHQKPSKKVDTLVGQINIIPCVVVARTEYNKTSSFYTKFIHLLNHDAWLVKNHIVSLYNSNMSAIGHITHRFIPYLQAIGLPYSWIALLLIRRFEHQFYFEDTN